MKCKRILLILTALLLSLSALLSGVACTAPEVPPEESTVIESSEFLPAPDEIVLQYDGHEVMVSHEKRDALYAMFCEVIDQAESIKQSEGEIPENGFVGDFYPCVEFRYAQRHAYSLPADGELAFANHSFEYERIQLTVPTFSVAVYRDGQYCGIDGMQTRIALLPEGNLYIRDAFAQAVTDELLQNIVKIERDPVNTEVLETEIFAECPDNMVLIRNGEAKTLSEEQQTELYQNYLQMIEELERLDTCHCVFEPYNMLQYFSQNTCLEFQYEQRRRFVGMLTSEAEQSALIVGPQEFDALLFVLDIMGDKPMVLGYKDGQYYSFHSAHVYINSNSNSFVTNAMSMAEND